MFELQLRHFVEQVGGGTAEPEVGWSAVGVEYAGGEGAEVGAGEAGGVVGEEGEYSGLDESREGLEEDDGLGLGLGLGLEEEGEEG